MKKICLIFLTLISCLQLNAANISTSDAMVLNAGKSTALAGGTTNIRKEVDEPISALSPVKIPGLTNGASYIPALSAVNAVGLSVNSTAITASPVSDGPVCNTYTNQGTTNGLGGNTVLGVYANGTTFYAATTRGLSISTDGGSTFTNKTTTDGLGNNYVYGVYAIQNTVYAATYGGLSISTDGGSTFTNKTTTDGLGNNYVYGVYAIQNTVYAATNGGLSISTNGGNSFTNYTTANGLVGDSVLGVYAIGTTVYAATNSGLSISTNGGTSFTNYTTSNNLGDILVRGVYAIGTTVYAATQGGLSISTDGGTNFLNRTTANGLGSNIVRGVYAIGTTVYAATQGGLSISTDGGASFTNYKTTNGLGSNTVYGVYASGSSIYAATNGGLSFCMASVPSAPTSLSAVAGYGQLQISFTAGVNGGNTITNYEYTLNGGTTWTPVNPVDGTSPVTITGLTNGTSYTLALRAVNALGFSDASASVTAIVVTEASNLTIDPIPIQTYTGSALTPAIVVKDGATTLTEGTHYSVAYSNNTNVGTATVTITGLGGNPTGTKTVTFGITIWTARASAADNRWYGVTYGNGLFVAVSDNGTGNRVMTSPDGINWTSRRSAADNDWTSVTYGNGLFVAVAEEDDSEDLVMTSPDGINWTSRRSAADNDWTSVTYGNGLFVAVSDNGTGNRVMTSPDGINWTSRTSAANNRWYGVTYGNGLFVAVASSGTGNRVMTSPDGITWTARTSAADLGWFSVTYGNGLFVAVATTGTGNRVMTSPDGINWTSRTSAADNNWYGVTYGNGLFVAVAEEDDSEDLVMTSPDGITWTAQTPATYNDWTSVTYGNGLFVAVSDDGTGNRVMTLNAVVSRLTIDAIANQTYTGSALTPTIVVKDGATTLTLGTHYSVAYSNNTNVGTATVTITGLGNYTGTKTETFGISMWTARTSAADNSWISVTYGNGLFVAIAGSGTGNRVMTSPDGITWTARTSAADLGWFSVTYGNGLFVAVATTGTGNRVMTSPDGINWTSRLSAADNTWYSVTYGNGLFVAVAGSGAGTDPGNQVMTSPDGITWTLRTSAADNNWYDVTYGNGLFVAVAATGAGNRVMTSPDGITWTARTSAADNIWSSVTYGNGLFVAVASSGTGNRVMTSPDGITWTARTSAADNFWWGLTYGNGLFVAVSFSGTGNRVMSSPDGITWTAQTPAADNNWYGVTYGNGLFVAVGNTGTGNRVMTLNAVVSRLTIDAIANQTFTGSALTPTIVVKDDATTLTLGTHYSVAYSNNTNVGTATVTITGMGNYVGTKSETFAIVAKPASTLTIDAIANQTYTGSALTPAIVVKDGATTLTVGTHYSLAYSNNTNVGTATLTITGIGVYTGTKTQTFTIVAKAASTLAIDAIANQTYTGSAITPTVVVKDGATTLTLGTDYSVAYSNNTNVGTATVTITGTGNYTGTKTQTFSIVAKAASTLTIDPITNQTYTGSAITPTVVVKDGSTKLALGTDYTIAYSSNTNVGTATVTITGTGNYSGTKTQTFSIVAKAASTLTIEAIANQTYTGSAISPTVVVKDGSTTLTLGTDYTVAYSSNTNVGTATVTIMGTGNYSGANPQTFAILPKAVILQANNASKIFGDANPSLSFSYSGLVAGDTEIDQVPVISTTASTTSGVGNYPITLTGGSDPNYSLTLVEGVLQVSPAPLSLTVNAVTKIYGQADPVYTYSLLGLKGSDTEAVLGGAFSREAGEDPGTYRISQGSLSAGANYTLTVTGASLQILKAKVSSVAQLALVTTAWSKEAALPATVKVLAAHGQDFQVEVKWDKSTLNLLARGTYSLTGTLILPAGIENPNQVFAKIQVQVFPKPAPRDVTITNNTFVGSTTQFFISVGDFKINDPVDNIHVVSLLGKGYDNTYFQIKDNILFWNSAERAAGKTTFSIVVRVTDRDGNTFDKFFEIKRTRPDFSTVTIFNTFTPNADRFNDTWGVPEVRFYEGARISVYDRGGSRLFYTENPDVRWDGTYDGKEMPVGTYYWVIQIDETGATRRGIVNLLRK